jgi:precorrin-6B methylase 2
MLTLPLRGVLYLTLGLGAFGAAHFGPDLLRSRQPVVPSGVGDSSRRSDLLGVSPGRHLVAYVLVSSSCGFCRLDEVKAALGSIRYNLRRAHAVDFTRISVVAVSVDETVGAGLGYLGEIGLDKFDQLVVGGGWLNPQVISYVWQKRWTLALVPQVILVSRAVGAEEKPASVSVAADSVLRVVHGRDELLNWVRQGTPAFYETRVVREPEPRPEEF